MTTATTQSRRQRGIQVVESARTLQGDLVIPERPVGVVVFAHGSGSGRFSPRNRAVAAELQEAGLATVLMDLLEPAEADDTGKVFDINLLARGLAATIHWLGQQEETKSLPIGLFGASTGSAAALVAAAEQSERIAAVVSRGGRPDLAWEDLPGVVAPTRLIVGGDDEVVLELNRKALDALSCTKDLIVIPGATHLFSEPGALEQVAELAADWFLRHVT